MPELPEVETICRQLDKAIKGKKIADIEVLSEKQFSGDKKDVINCAVKSVKRIGKMINIALDNNYAILIHLKMTGQLTTLSHKYTRIIFTFDDNSKLFFNDLRKFGWIRVIPSDQTGVEGSLGIDALSIKLTTDYLQQVFQRKKNTAIKSVLMDQSLISGIGNIYSDEILFCAKILPFRKAGEINNNEIKKLKSCIPNVLETAIEYGGTSFSDYRQADGKRGGYLDVAKVYGRKKAKCRLCGNKIQFQKVGQRTAHYCSNCQK
ncbi:MAG: formamidopyrimidine-DNA glycosylase [Candidatus Berkelbacteria bacterium Licking1014_85]|uniref:Formamidopyrimidine-DNA glycosylase n=1 Tax=Candidatus Berkelbacteria bacterium Licking1014_85 TaxID=2017148 RepID=A0A554LJX3_9BACT|nr:MAG: formamidopyrimidine-DNA glycosylase [Candidatus Berkelbacteria bacterium Licking1014_85]